jgi:hypothetical protein
LRGAGQTVEKIMSLVVELKVFNANADEQWDATEEEAAIVTGTLERKLKALRAQLSQLPQMANGLSGNRAALAKNVMMDSLWECRTLAEELVEILHPGE